MTENEILVSVLCAAFNHGKYIRRCLEGFVSQKTSFAFEIIVHDDASTDDTADVIREFEAKYPDMIKPIYQTENQYSRKINIKREHMMPRIRGKFVALCEGDDFWTDEKKLQRQVDAMLAHPECRMCTHRVAEVLEDGTPDGTLFPADPVSEGVLDSRTFLDIGQYYSFHTSSYFFRTEDYMEYVMTPPDFVKKSTVGDEAHLMYFGQLGPVYYIDRIMSHYRRGVAGSWTARQRASAEKAILHPKQMIETFQSFDEYTQGRFHDLMVNRISRQMAIVVILEKNAASMLRKENREYFQALSLSRKAFILASSLLPGPMKAFYLKRLNSLDKVHGVQ